MNLVAEKIETNKASEIYDCSLVPSDQISLVWDQIEKYLRKICQIDQVAEIQLKTIYYRHIK
jgi:hypothetical protein